MKKLIILIPFLFFVSNCSHFDYTIPALEFTSGIATSYAIHEAGHQIAANGVGMDLDWKFNENNQIVAFEYNQVKNSDYNISIVNSAGLITQQLSSEFIISQEIKTKFHDGIMFWNTINPILYSIDHFFLHKTNHYKDGNPYGDIACIEKHSGKKTADAFALIMITLSSFNLQRYIDMDSERYSFSIGPDRIVWSFNF